MIKIAYIMYDSGPELSYWIPEVGYWQRVTTIPWDSHYYHNPENL